MAGVPADLELTEGEERRLELPGPGTAGYVWQHDLRGEEGVVDIRWARGYPAGTPRAPAGASAPETATIRALRAGAVEVVLYQRRPWEPPERALTAHHLSVLVRTP